MKLAAAHAIARVIPDDELHADYIIPSVFNRRVAEAVADAVANAAVASGVARRKRGATGRAHDAAGGTAMTDRLYFTDSDAANELLVSQRWRC